MSVSQYGSNPIFAVLKFQNTLIQKVFKINSTSLNVLASFTYSNTFYNINSVFAYANNYLYFAFKSSNPEFITVAVVDDASLQPSTYIQFVSDSSLPTVSDETIITTS